MREIYIDWLVLDLLTMEDNLQVKATKISKIDIRIKINIYPKI